jgi:hypothetical protein
MLHKNAMMVTFWTLIQSAEKTLMVFRGVKHTALHTLVPVVSLIFI